MGTTEDRLHLQLAKWREELINLGRINRLLYFRHTKSASLEIVQPGPAVILERLQGSGATAVWDFFLPDPPDEDVDVTIPPPSPGPNELVVGDKDTPAVRSALRLLERKTNQEWIDRGLWTLYLGLLMLEWVDPDDDRTVHSPLLLLPVTFSRASLQEPFRLRATEDDPAINPALAAKLRNDFGIELPGIEEFGELSTVEIADRVAEAIKVQKGWSIHDRAVLTNFTFHKEAMYRDLLDNAEAVAAHPMVQMLALGPDSPTAGDFAFEHLPEERLEEQVAPEELVSVLDADASQRRCILAARDGGSFVMDGPPGTGKSQTIVNTITELIKTGRSVLFVSEKAAALEVVYERLRAAKLDEFVLQLHSHNATRKAVAAELGRSLNTRPTARSSMPDTSVARLLDARRQLTSYAQALNEIRQPFGRSLHEVLGRIAQLHDQPQAPAPAGINAGFTPERLARVLTSAATLGRNWGPVTRGDDFLWRDLADEGSVLSIQRCIDEAREHLDDLAGLLGAVEADFRLGWDGSPQDAARMRDLLQLVASRPDVPTSWLAGPVDAIERRIEELSRASEDYHRLAEDLRRAVGTGWTQLDTTLRDDIVAARTGMTRMIPPLPLPGTTTAGDISRLIEAIRPCGRSLRQLADDARTVGDAFGLPTGPVTLQRAANLAQLGTLADSPVRPEAAWLNPGAVPAAEDAAAALRQAVGDYHVRHAALNGRFTDTVLELNLEAIVSRAAGYKGLGKLKGSYRSDKKALAACAADGNGKEALAMAAEALAWQQSAKTFEQTEQDKAHLLGQFYVGLDTDFEKITAGLTVAQRAISLASPYLDVAATARQLGRDTAPDGAITRAAHRMNETATSVVEIFSTVGGATFVDRVASTDLVRLADWADEVVRHLETIHRSLRTVERLTGFAGAVDDTCTALEKTDKARMISRSLEQSIEEHRLVLGPAFRGVETDWAALRGALQWAHAARQLCGEYLSEELAQTIVTTGWKPDALEERLALWEKSERALLSHFSPSRAAELAADLEVSFDEGGALLVDLDATRGDIEEWFAYADATRRLCSEGLEEAVSFCVRRKLPGDSLADVVERTVLEAWAEAVIATDRERLAPIRAKERDALRLDFQALDAQIVANAAAQVINTCAARRPTSIAGAAGVIARQAQLQKKHKPIRKLLEEAGSVVLDLKPCFMMSPLSVSQYLPPGFTFDVVIFDEASQVRPSDAINCVYRGRQLIVAGDQKQLPPSAFFARGAAADDDGVGNDDDEVEDFESVLDLCKAAGGLPSLPLNWHYRSQHESLITYSNYSFYEGRLSTFPGATEHAPDLGIELFKVDGVYRRGTGRDNPVEAAKVIDRVLFHRHHHPDQSLGVVAFSQAQEDAIVQELERRADQHPELGGLIGEDRLRGFFVKNLEDVQGDERDIIIFSIGYGPDEFGKFTLQMGPLNRQGGWRRLNVAITRARRRVEIVTSVLPAHFIGELKNDGLRHLRRYLDFALRGTQALALDLSDSDGDTESPFEEEVLRTIRGWGFDAVPQVGCAAYRIDIGIRHPDQPGLFLLAVECDGAMYHSSKVARDRDRLRQAVLEGLGWRFHRIWGISWYRDRAGEQERLRAAIDAALSGEADPAPSRALSEPRAVEVATESIDFSAPPGWVTPYRSATLPPANSSYEMHAPEARARLRQLVRLAIEQEAPVHEERVLRAAREAWGVGRAGARIREAFASVIGELSRLGVVQRDRAGFIRLTGAEPISVRVPTEQQDGIRPISQLPPEELQAALIGMTSDANSIGRDDLTVRVARLFGWGRVGVDISNGIDAAIARAVQEGALTEDQDFLKVAPS